LNILLKCSNDADAEYNASFSRFVSFAALQRLQRLLCIPDRSVTERILLPFFPESREKAKKH
jgi:hypothetical protein